MFKKEFIILGRKIRKIRIEKKLSLSDLGSMIGMEKANVSRLESGKTNPTLMTLFKVADALEVEVEAFFEKDGKQE